MATIWLLPASSRQYHWLFLSLWKIANLLWNANCRAVKSPALQFDLSVYPSPPVATMRLLLPPMPAPLLVLFALKDHEHDDSFSVKNVAVSRRKTLAI